MKRVWVCVGMWVYGCHGTYTPTPTHPYSHTSSPEHRLQHVVHRGGGAALAVAAVFDDAGKSIIGLGEGRVADEPGVRQPVALVSLRRAGLPSDLHRQRIEYIARGAAGNHRPHHLGELPRIYFTERPA